MFLYTIIYLDSTSVVFNHHNTHYVCNEPYNVYIQKHMFLFLYLYVLKVREMSALCIGQITYYQHKNHLNCLIVCIILVHKIKMYFIASYALLLN